MTSVQAGDRGKRCFGGRQSVGCRCNHAAVGIQFTSLVKFVFIDAKLFPILLAAAVPIVTPYVTLWLYARELGARLRRRGAERIERQGGSGAGGVVAFARVLLGAPVVYRVGLPASRWIRTRWLADLVYLAMKPAEWGFYVMLLLLDRDPPERRIDRMYRGFGPTLPP